MADLSNYLSGDKPVKIHEQRERLRAADETELREILKDVEAEILNLRTQAIMQNVENPMRLRAIRKMVARIHTELSERERKAQTV
ncbi:MAG TPA: 50S ribosomal protein L29 [Abditibacteriaceae bacterium]|nr:50S ribosomal protein L29 [Abditibacteriaceae bacterium]